MYPMDNLVARLFQDFGFTDDDAEKMVTLITADPSGEVFYEPGNPNWKRAILLVERIRRVAFCRIEREAHAERKAEREAQEKKKAEREEQEQPKAKKPNPFRVIPGG